jgi:hypothetical protein
MAKLKYGIFGPLSGKLGSLIGSSWMGIPYLKKAAKDANRERSPAQQANSQKFAYVNLWLIPFHAYIIVGFDALAIGKTSLAAAFSLIYNTVFTGTMPDLKIDYSKMQISSGSLNGLVDVSLTYIDDHLIKILWDDNSGPTTHFNDQVMVVFYNEELEMTDGFVGMVNRLDKEYVFALEPVLIGKPLHAYIAVTSYNRKKASNTTYLGLIEKI